VDRGDVHGFVFEQRAFNTAREIAHYRRTEGDLYRNVAGWNVRGPSSQEKRIGGLAGA
jgi:hypothetical protein